MEINYFNIDSIRKHSRIPVKVVKNKKMMVVDFADEILSRVKEGNSKGDRTVVILPVGPTGQWKQMAEIAKQDRIDLSGLHIISMDEYLMPDNTTHIPETDPLSFAGFIKQNFLIDAIKYCGFKKENWAAPDSSDIGKVDRMIKKWGGVDIAFGGIGLNGHLAFNEAPSPTDSWTEEKFKVSPVRIQKIAAVTKATNSIFGTGGCIGMIPDFAVTIGMKQILGAHRIHIFLDWLWQRYMLRRALLGPITMHFPASLVQNHPDVQFTVTEDVAEIHTIIPE